jgi:tetratricopeptide (TPR) repeat protein
MKPFVLARASVLAISITTGTAVAHEGHDHGDPDVRPPEKLGKVSFPTSCDRKVQPLFERGVALLHSFWFGEGLKAFTAVAEQDPGCAMAYWGIALNRLLNPFNGEAGASFVKHGQAAIEKARTIGAKTERERDYIDAAALLYTDIGVRRWQQRAIAYEEAMGRLVAKYPEDLEAKVFYALALNFAADLNDQTYAKPLKAAGLLEPLLSAHPDHPGVAHFLIHSYDFPPLAGKGLAAARRYASIAPSAAHALHMPSHIFTRVGAWEDSASTNVRSEQTARADSSGDEILHAIDYQVYAYLQMARDADAKKAIDRGMADAARFSFFRPAGPFGEAAAAARYALERGEWSAAAQLMVKPTKFPHVDAISHFARALGAARAGDAAAARPDLVRLAELRDQLTAAKNTYWAGQVEIQRLAASAWTALAEGRREEGLSLMQRAADQETSSEKASISPGPILPARELLGDMLLELGRPALALKEYEASHQREPNRFRGWFGAASAAAQAGEREKARAYYAKLVELARGGESRAELTHARRYLADSPT